MGCDGMRWDDDFDRNYLVGTSLHGPLECDVIGLISYVFRELKPEYNVRTRVASYIVLDKHIQKHHNLSFSPTARADEAYDDFKERLAGEYERKHRTLLEGLQGPPNILGKENHRSSDRVCILCKCLPLQLYLYADDYGDDQGCDIS